MSKNRYRGSKLTSVFLLATLIFSGLSPITLFTSTASAASASIVVDPATYSGSGTTITDTVSSINGTMSNITFESSTNCGVFNYNGSNSAIQFPQKNFGTAFSISTWIRASEGATSGQPQFDIQTLMSNVGANVAPSGFKVFINNWNSNDGKLIHQAGNNSTGTDVYSNDSNLISINQWHHIVFTFNQSSPAVSIYKDGTKLNTTGTPVSNIGMNNSNWWLGSMGGNSYWYKGKMGITKIYQTVLNQTEVTEDYNSTSARYASTPTCPVSAPTISSAAILGTANVGQTLTANVSLGGGTPSSTTYQWKSSDTASGTYSDISGATSSTHVVGNTQVGKFLKYTLTVSNSAGSATSTTSASSRVSDGLFLNYDAGNSSSYSGSGSTVTDLSGSGYGGTLTGASLTTPGFVSIYGKSFSFNATNSQYIDVADIPAISFVNGFSATVWANFGGTATNSFERVFDFGNGQGNNNIIFGRQGTAGDLFLEVWNAGVSAGFCVAAGGVQTGWAHYAVTISGSTCTFYVNGSALTSGVTGTTAAPNAVARTSNYIGRSNWSVDKYFESGIGRISMWNRALSSSEVATRATSETPANEVVLSVSSISATRGSAISSLTSATYGGTPTSYSISPALPTGVSLNSSTGTVSGTPSVGLSSTTFTITANGVTGSPTANFTLAVAATALSNASAPSVSQTVGSVTNSLTVTFSSITNATSHTVRLYQTDGTTLISTQTGFASGSTLTGLSPSTSYKISLQAIGDGLSYSTSNESSKTSSTTAAAAGSPAISSQPSDSTKGSGLTSSFTVTAGNSGVGTLSYQWQVSTDSGSNWTNVGTNSNSYTTGTLSTSDNGKKYKVVVTNTHNSTTATTTSNVVTLTVPNPPNISGTSEITHSFDQRTYTSGQTATFTYTLKCSVAQPYGPSFYDMVGYEGGPSWSYNDSLSSGTSSDGGYTWTVTKTRVLNVNGTWWSSPYMRGACLDSFNFTYPAKVLAYVGVPGISSLSITSGSKNGGETLTIAGFNLNNVSGATIGGTAATIVSQTSTSLVLTTPARAVGSNQSVVLTNPSGTQSKYDNASRTSVIFSFLDDAPTISSATISGTTNAGSTLTASASGTGGGTITSTTYQWMSSTTSGGTYTNISGATLSTYTIPFSQAGKFIKVTVTVSNSGGSASATSSATSRIGNAAYVDLLPAVYSSGSTWSSLAGTTSAQATMYNSPTFTSAGLGSYFSLNGTNQWMSIDTGANNPSTFTISAWFRIASGDSGKIIGFENNQSISGTNYDRMLYVGSDGYLYWGICNGSTCATNVRKSTTRVDDNNWHLATVTLSSSTNTLYLNGTAQGATLAGSGYGSYANPSYWKIGGIILSSWTGAGNGYFKGDIGRVTIYTSAKTSGEVTTYFNSDTSNFANAAPTIGSASISGTLSVGSTLTATAGTLGGGTASSTTYQWTISSDGSTYSNIAGATSSTYTLVSGDVGKYVKVSITLSNASGSASATSSATSAIAQVPPTIGGATISGTVAVSQVLTASSASLGGGAVTSTTYQWKISSDGTTFSDITGETSRTYTLVSGDVSKFIRVDVTVTNSGGSASATSSSTVAVAALLQAPTLTGAAIAGTTTQGQTLTASIQGAGGGTASTTTYQWSRADTSTGTYSNISGATSSTYVLASADATKFIKVTISVSNSAGGPNSATSSATNQIAIIAPTIGSATFSGTTTVGQTLTATANSLGGGTVASTAYQWRSATTAAGVYSDITGATSNTYVLTANEAGKYIRVVVTVTNTAGSASATSNASSAAVISNVPTPTISSISPNAGTTAGGTSVTISGTNLSTVTAVTFDGTAATISTKTTTQLVVTTPAHSAGAVNVVVTNTAGSVTSANGFTYANTPTTRSWTATPTITSGANGDPFSVTYQAVCTTPQRFGPSMYDLIYITPGVWIYNTYMGSGTSTDGGYTWTITKNYTINSNGIWKLDAYQRGACWGTSNFVYATQNIINVGISGPTITSLNTTSGPTAGGTATTITGTNLTGVTAITVGGAAATSIRSNNATSVTFNTPAGTAGAKNVVVTTTAGSVTGTNAFTYVAPITITYNVNGGSGSPSRTSDSYTPNTGGYSVPVVGTMARTGYTFGGWATANDSSTAITSPYNPTSSLTVYAIWTAINYTNNYNANGATGGSAPSTTTNAFGSTVTVAGNSGSLARTGFTLAGWNTLANGTGTSYNLGAGTFTQGAGNQILYADWVADTYTVSYDVNGSGDAVPAAHTGKLANSSVTLAAGVTKTNFAFVGWESGGITYRAGATFIVGSANATVVAKWIEVFKLSYNLNGTGASGSVPADFQYASGDPVTVTNVVPTRAGYTFGGWINQSGGAHATSSTYAISGTNYLLYAVWNAVPYTVTYALNGGQGTAPTETSKNISSNFLVATVPTKIGSTFTGWSDGSTVLGAGSSYLVGTADITLTAQWSANSYAITYDLAQGTSSVPSPVSKNYQASWNLPDAPTRVGYNFADWYDGTNGYAAAVSYTLGTATDLTLTARWNAIVFYTVTYDLDGGLGNAPTQDPLQNGETFTLPSEPTKTGNSFTGWSYAGTTYSAGQVIPMPAANVTVTALWTATSAGTFAITYITNGAQTAAPTVPPLTENSTFTIDDGSGLIKNAYIFSGWSRSGTIYLGGETFTMPASSVTFSAVWVPSVRATAVTHSADSTSITRGRSITVTYSLGCYVFSSTIPTIFENVSTTGESFINDITSSLTVIDAGYNWTVTRVYTLSLSGTYTIFATASGGCFGTSTDSTSSTVTVTDPPTSSAGTSSGATTPAPETATTSTPARTGSIQPVTVVGAKIALVANRTYTLPKLSAPTLSVEARTGASSSSSTTTTQTNGTSLTTTTMLSVNSASKGLSEVKIVENQIAVIPTVGFSGKTDVTVTVTDGTSTTTITVPVTVLPEPVKDPMITPIAARQTSVTWEASPNANSYQVIVDGKTACKAATDSCEVKKILGPNADVQVIANGGDATKSDAVDADYEANKTVVLTKLVGTTKGAILTPNDINMLNKVIATVKAQGFETVTISQITTTRVNSAAAKARINALVNYVKSRSGDPDLVVTVVPAPAKTSMNQIAVK